MREDLEKLVFDTLQEVAKPEISSFDLRRHIDAILQIHDRIVEDETELAYENGMDNGSADSYWEIDDARSEGYDEGYSDGYDEARAEFEGNDPAGA